MNILVYGAGVLGSLYAALLQRSGQQVSILARGQHLIDICAHGIVLEDASTGIRTTQHVHVVEQLAPDDVYDLVIVLMREQQVTAVLSALATNKEVPTFLFMGNDLAGPAAFIESVGKERVLLGFPGAGGLRDGHTIRYHILAGWQQPTVVGELDGRTTTRVRDIVRAFKAAGFSVTTCENMVAWYQTHVAWTLPVATALYLANGDVHRLARTRDTLVLLVRAVRENFRALKCLNVPITPSSLRVFDRMPELLLVPFLGRLLNTGTAEIVIAGHANAARDEYRYLAEAWRTMAQATRVVMPSMERLDRSIDLAVPVLPDGSAEIPLNWDGVKITMALFASLSVVLRWWHVRRR